MSKINTKKMATQNHGMSGSNAAQGERSGL